MNVNMKIRVFMKTAINAVFGLIGFEVQKKGKRPFMQQGLLWLSRNGFDVKTVLDVGASNGSWSKLCAKGYPTAEYVLFEPQPVHESALSYLAIEKSFKMQVVKKAVGLSSGVTYFDVTDPFGGALCGENEAGTIAVEMTTIDEAVAELSLSGPFLLKLDTHGFEKGILDGAAKTLSSCNALVIEAYNYRIASGAMLFFELCNYMAERGFRPVDIVDVLHRPHDHSLWQMDIVFVRGDWAGFGYVRFS